MQQKKRQEKILPVPELKSQVTEILVANGRSFQPFIRTFHYTGENITKSNLGTLIGVFEIDEMSEDCAYIVNFLASVAKKEYFSNPRRGAIESFEAALHKINLALSELVKHGNVTWLGKLHGTLGVLEKNNIHFSVTGQSSILLIRNDSISDISAGLASEESRIHPIKTFVEVSSGRLNLEDRILLTSPELLALFSLEELAKNVRRMDHDQFLQFLKTALINELDMAGTILVDVAEEIIVNTKKISEKPTQEKSLERVSNIFSQSAFLPKKSHEPASVEEGLSPEQEATVEPEEEYIDTKTGHIYVQGTPPAEPGKNARFDHLILGFEELLDSSKFFLLSQGKWLRKGKRYFLIGIANTQETLQIATQRMVRITRKQWKSFRTPKVTLPPIEKESSLVPQQEKRPQESQSFSDISSPPLVTPPPSQIREVDVSTQKNVERSHLPHLVTEKLNLFYKKNKAVLPTSAAPPESKNLTEQLPSSFVVIHKTLQSSLRNISSQVRHFLTNTIAPSLQTAYSLFNNLSGQKKGVFFAIAIAGVALLTGWFLWPDNTDSESSITTENKINTLVTPEQTAHTNSPAEIIEVLKQLPEPIIGSVVLNEEAYVITKSDVISVADNKSYPLPGTASAQFATTMDDLRLVFIATTDKKLYAWSPISKTFVENTLALADGANIVGIDTYLTYLYILDSTNDQVYRFPRADSGFGESTAWLKDSVTIDATSDFGVNESLYISQSANTIKGYFRGREANTFEAPTNLTITDLYTHPGLQNIYVLDAEHNRVIIWNQDGKLLKEFTHEKFSEGKTLSVNEKAGEIFISTENTLLSYKLK